MKGLLQAIKPYVPQAIKRPIKRLIHPQLRGRTAGGWHRQVIGGLWDEIGKHQFDYMVGQGLKPEHRFLDVGCGSLRGGVHFIRYLKPGHYYGIDKSQEILDAGRKIELANYQLFDRAPVLMQTDTFDFQALNQRFPFALAQSVFTHIPLNAIIRCLMNIEKVLEVGGRFYATFFENPQGKQHVERLAHQCTDGPDVITYFDRDPFHYDRESFQWICQGTHLHLEYVGDWGHPRGQRMLVFVKS